MSRNIRQSDSEHAPNRADAFAPLDVAFGGSSDEPAPGAHLITPRRGYEHHGIYVGHGKVIHYAGFDKTAHRGPVEEVSLEQFAGGYVVGVRPHPLRKYSGEDAVLRARSRLGEDRYRLLTNNCEHFCAWCLLGESRSEQVHACFTHPRMCVHALLCFVCTFIGSRINGNHVVVRAA
ncbi:lecithin retinol acyltransferase family protein [Paraburkholderia sp. JHI869]|uniref:lecithin retinol acyltransferase family protein n=1 Tax=Paraburkholderia sp. JHI869 TaxID=3112959 RepID=UPI00317C026E